MITLGAGNDVVLGGAGSNTISAKGGNDVVVGHNGTVGYATPGVLSVIATSDPSFGGDDTIKLGGGSDTSSPGSATTR